MRLEWAPFGAPSSYVEIFLRFSVIIGYTVVRSVRGKLVRFDLTRTLRAR